MKSSKKRNIGIGIILFFIMIGSFGYSYLKNDGIENKEVRDDEEQLEESDTTLVVDEAGSISLGDQYEEVMINVPGVQLENGSTDHIYVTEGASDGELTLLNVKSKELTVQGEDSNSIIIDGASEIQSVILDRAKGSIDLVVKDKSIVESLKVYGDSQEVNLEGDFASIDIGASNTQVDIRKALVDSLSVSGNHSTINVDKNSSIKSAIVLADATDNKIVFNGTVENTTIDGKNNSVDFNGKTESVYVREDAENTILTVGKNAVVESLITLVPLRLNRNGQINKVIADSTSYIKENEKNKELAANVETKKNNKQNRRTRKIARSSRSIGPKKSVQSTRSTKLKKQVKPTGPARPKKPTQTKKPEKVAKPNKDNKAGKDIKPGKNNKPIKDNKPKEPEDSEKDELPETNLPEVEEPEKPEEDEIPETDLPEVEGPEESESENNLLAKEILDANLAFMYERLENPTFGIGGGEWAILSLARGEYDVPKEYYDLYHENTVDEVKRLMKQYNGKLDRNKGTEHSRLMLAFGALGMDITDVGGYDIREALTDFDFVTRQGINGPIFGLIALDTHGYELPVIDDQENQSSRQRFIDYILDKEISETGGWSLGGRDPDPDITGMAIQGLTPYYEDQAEVKEAVDKGIEWLSEVQNENGGYLSWGTENSESVVQVIVALTGLGIDPHNDARFIKNEHSAIDNLLTYAVSEGGFRHVQDRGENGMATEQGNYALVAYDRFVNNRNPLYDMTDVALELPELPEEPQLPEEPEEEELPEVEEPEEKNNLLAKEVLDTNLAYLHEIVENPNFGVMGGEWAILSLARGGYDVPEEYYDLYEDNVVEEVERLMKKYKGKLNRNKGTEHSRLMLAFGALGKDIRDVGGYDIREALADYRFVNRQGINGPIFALIALDTHGYEIPDTEDPDNQSTRQKFIDEILSREITQETGERAGWSLGGKIPDPDITAMAIQGLTPYYDDQAEVKEAVDRGLEWLSEAQDVDGGYLSWGSNNSESVSQVIVALTGLGIDPHNDARFIKNGHSALDNLLNFANAEGGFHHLEDHDVDQMATEQGTYALVAYDRFINKRNRLYDMTDRALERKQIDPVKTEAKVKTETRTKEKTKTKGRPEIKIEIKLESKPEEKAEAELEEAKTESEEPNDAIDALTKAKATAQSELNRYEDTKDKSENEERVVDEKEEGLKTIEAATSPEEVEQALEEAKISIDAIEKDVKHDSEIETELPETVEAQ